MSGFLLDQYIAGETIYCHWHTFDGERLPITISDLAVGDIVIYKNGSTTQRSSTAGFALLDSDGIDFDGATGIHGISIDLADNTDAGFYVAGAQYTVVLNAFTLDGDTVRFVLGSFRISAAALDAAGIRSAVGLASANLDTQLDALPTAAENATAVWANGARTLTAIDEDSTTLDLDAAIRAALGLASANLDTQLEALPTANENADALLGRNIAGGSSTGRRVFEALYVLRNRVAIAGGVMTIYGVDDATPSWTAATTQTAGDPLSEIDPT